ncbi:HNH endonuclease [Gordonia phage Murp]|nr:HNH endonuclease [Gordonia phage Murp]
MPRAGRIALYWASSDGGDDFSVDLFTPHCFRCRRRVHDWTDLERAHLVDRARGGTDFECNLAMLCSRCHRIMPSFGGDDAIGAMNWVRPRSRT